MTSEERIQYNVVAGRPKTGVWRYSWWRCTGMEDIF